MNNLNNNIVPNWNDDSNNITNLVIAESSVTESNSEINNLGGNYDPFIEIHKQPTFLPSGKQSGAYAITLGDNEKEVGIVKDNYLLIENQKISEIGKNIMADSGINFQPDRMFFNGKQFREIYVAKDAGLQVKVPKVGDLLGLVCEIQNSYDSSIKAGINIYFQRLVCENGMLSKAFGFGHTFWHTKNNVDWANEITKATQVLKNQSVSRLQSFAEACGRLQKPIELQDIASIRQNYLPKLPTQQFGQMIDKYLADKDYSAWGLLNAGTNVLWHSNKLTTANFNNNTMVVDAMLEYGKTLTLDELDLPKS
tara:strand:- start:44 stop:973 length:930 start_codon:yes stop_codon:yes gene_type:complete